MKITSQLNNKYETKNGLSYLKTFLTLKVLN